MYRTLISTAILTFMFFTGCTDNSTGPNENYTIDDMIGTWNMVSSTMDMTMAMDFSTAFLYIFDEDDCTLSGGTYVDGYGCTMSDIMISILAPPSIPIITLLLPEAAIFFEFPPVNPPELIVVTPSNT